MKHFLIVLLWIGSLGARAATVIETEQVKQIKPSNSLSTCGYKPSSTEQAYFSKLAQREKVNGSFLEGYSIHGKKDAAVAWFGIVRGVAAKPDAPNHYNVLLEHKFFDGMTDCHIMLVSESGGGDFHAEIDTGGPVSLPPLALVRVYGKVVREENGVPVVAVDYARVWPWFTFTLTDLGPKDQGNPKWRKLCKPCQGGRIYNPFPNEQYYMNVLGDPRDFAPPPAQGRQSH